MRCLSDIGSGQWTYQCLTRLILQFLSCKLEPETATSVKGRMIPIICDKVVFSTKDQGIKERLLRETDLTLSRCLSLIGAAEES